MAIAARNKPRERRAQIVANAQVKAIKDANPEKMPYEEEKKLGYQALEEARVRVGAKKEHIVISDKEWEAIQAGAVSDSKLNRILNDADMDRVKELATPRNKVLMTSAKTARAKKMMEQGATRQEIATQLGVSLATLDRELYGEG